MKSRYYVILIVFVFGLFHPISSAITEKKFNDTPTFVTELPSLKGSLDLTYTSKTINLDLPVANIKARIKRFENDERIEPITLTIPNNKNYIKNLSDSLARPKKNKELEELFAARLKEVQNNSTGEGKNVITLKKEDFKLIHPKKLGQFFRRTHQNVIVQTQNREAQSNQYFELIAQLTPFLPEDRLKLIKQKIIAGDSLSVDELLLPNFARKANQRFPLYRGPNCFHSALSFAAPSLSQSSLVNIRREPNYHEAMINFDELWKIIQNSFYEVDPNKATLKYGDMIVFFDFEPNQPVSYRWIKHAATYLFGPFTFSKGSKSANSPYSVKTLSEEWETWQRNSKNMGIKVFRRSQNNARTAPVMELSDWLY